MTSGPGQRQHSGRCEGMSGAYGTCRQDATHTSRPNGWHTKTGITTTAAQHRAQDCYRRTDGPGYNMDSETNCKDLDRSSGKENGFP
ncbi:hypothetical protein E2C01_074401 [Portunus trituberculatus]|uniref:Uncharacterized protein n=1 Tax=Portunus trituberculatus TaxID=210409 RepID=A0A5B7I5K9_PORTR|nr:hypothetical protein [Portunus trituberculatus]